jgi:hypothetical protein
MRAFAHIKENPGGSSLRAGGNVIMMVWSGLTNVQFNRRGRAAQVI